MNDLDQNNTIKSDIIGYNSTGFMHPSATANSSEWFGTTTNPLGESERGPIYSNTPTTGNFVKGINYGFNIPQGSQIVGIEVMISHATWNGNAGYNATLGVELQWNKQQSTTNTGTQDFVDNKYKGWNNSFKNSTLGAANDLWGRTWSADDFMDNNFAVNTTLIDVNGGTEALDFVWVNVNYIPPVEPANITIQNSGDLDIILDNLANLTLQWNITFGFGEQLNLNNYVSVWYEVNGTSYNDSPGGVSYTNNSQVILAAAASFYDRSDSSFAGNFSSLLTIPDIYNVTLVAGLYDSSGNLNTYSSSSIFITVKDTSESTGTMKEPTLQFDQKTYNLELELTQLDTINVTIFTTLVNSSSYNFSNYTVYVMLNNSFQFSLSWQNNTFNTIDLTEIVSDVGYYVFDLVFEATAGDYYINSTVNVNLRVYEKDLITETTSTGTSSTTEPTNSTQLPELNLDFPFVSVISFFIGFAAIANYRKRMK